MYETECFENILENIYVIRKYNNGIHKATLLKAAEGYLLHNKNDNGYYDENDKYYPPTYCREKMTSSKTEEFLLKNYEAIKEEVAE